MTVDNDFLLVLESNQLGDGEPDLGEKLLKAFLTVLEDSGNCPARIVCMNSGVFLTTEGSDLVDVLKRFEAAGAEILSCGTCLAYYGREDKLVVGGPTDMKATVKAMTTFKKVVKP